MEFNMSPWDFSQNYSDESYMDWSKAPMPMSFNADYGTGFSASNEIIGPEMV
jgi:hypothetical protein